MTIKGLLYTKHGRVGTRSEGPDYWLQAFDTEYLLRFHDRMPWQPDYELAFHNGHIVEMEGRMDAGAFLVTRLWRLPVSYIPREEGRAHLGDVLRVALGARVSLADAPVEITFVAADDSRCPIGARCITEGQAVLTFDVSISDAAPLGVKVTLRAGHADLASATVEGYRIEAKRLDPYPTLHPSPSPSTSYATIVITRA